MAQQRHAADVRRRTRLMAGLALKGSMDSYRSILKRVGLVLVVVGLLDIAVMAYCIATAQSYSSSFNIFAVVGGIFLLRGSLGAVRLITWFSAFMLAGLGGALLVLFPLLKPAALWAAEFRQDPFGLSVSLGLGAAAVVLLFWVYRQLRAAPVVAARVAEGHSGSAPTFAFALGATLVVLLATIMHFTVDGAAGAKAIELAKAQHGEGYNYHVTAMRWSGTHVWANVSAYNRQEIKPIQVEWEQ